MIRLFWGVIKLLILWVLMMTIVQYWMKVNFEPVGPYGVSLDAFTAEDKEPVTHEPIYVGRRVIELEVYRTNEEVTKRCMPDGHPHFTELSGCAIPYVRKGTTTPTGAWVIITTNLRSWCDWERLKTWGHELAHTFGMDHTPDHSFVKGRQTFWKANDCTPTRYLSDAVEK